MTPWRSSSHDCRSAGVSAISSYTGQVRGRIDRERTKESVRIARIFAAEPVGPRHGIDVRNSAHHLHIAQRQIHHERHLVSRPDPHLRRVLNAHFARGHDRTQHDERHDGHGHAEHCHARAETVAQHVASGESHERHCRAPWSNLCVTLARSAATGSWVTITIVLFSSSLSLGEQEENLSRHSCDRGRPLARPRR